jgi:hypothetical protein
MIQLNPEFLKKDGKPEFAVLSYNYGIGMGVNRDGLD